jgi:hypothetical protein
LGLIFPHQINKFTQPSIVQKVSCDFELIHTHTVLKLWWFERGFACQTPLDSLDSITACLTPAPPATDPESKTAAHAAAHFGAWQCPLTGTNRLQASSHKDKPFLA